MFRIEMKGPGNHKIRTYDNFKIRIPQPGLPVGDLTILNRNCMGLPGEPVPHNFKKGFCYESYGGTGST